MSEFSIEWFFVHRFISDRNKQVKQECNNKSAK